jgi:hypothetical protein
VQGAAYQLAFVNFGLGVHHFAKADIAAGTAAGAAADTAGDTAGDTAADAAAGTAAAGGGAAGGASAAGWLVEGRDTAAWHEGQPGGRADFGEHQVSAAVYAGSR